MSGAKDTRAGRLLVAAVALVATYVFFYEYLPPFKRVHLFSDIEGFHYPLQRYAFQAFKEGRFPQWDASIYCGISFVGNVQAAVLYPPSWLMYAAGWRHPRLPFKLVEYFAIAHVWLGFLLCYLWLRGRRLGKLAGVFGAGVFAFAGYMVSQIVHPGAVTGMAWMPLGLWGIDEAVDRRDWRPLWKTALASAMCFLAGYPPSWIVFCATTFVYALASRAHWRAAAGVCAAVAASLLVSMAQLLPTLEARSLMVRDEKYGGGANTWSALIPFFVPNWFDFNMRSPLPEPDTLYFYLGLPALFAILWAARRHRLRPYVQALAVASFCLVLATNPDYQVYKLMARIPFLERMVQSYNFYEGVAAMAALLTAIALHDFFESAPRKPLPRWVMPGAIALLAVWSTRQLWIWGHGGVFDTGVRALAQTAIALALFSIAMWTLRAESGVRRACLAAVLLLAAGVDYKVFGTSRRFNTIDGDVDLLHNPYGIRGMNHTAYRAVWANRSYRVASDEQGAPNPTDFRFWGLAGAQGFDPFLPRQYRDLIEQWVHFRTNREFSIDFANQRMLQDLGIRYAITHEGVSADPFLAASPNFRRIGKDDSFYRIYEYQHAQAPYGWEDGSGDVRPTTWTPERRVFQVSSERGGRFYLVEQFFPGWQASVDGRPTSIGRWNRAFQSIQVAPGSHTVVFEYHSRYLPAGAVISLAAIVGLVAVILADRRKKAGRSDT